MTMFNQAGLPTPELASDIFGDAATPGARLEWLIRGACDCYERSAGWLNAARRDEEVIGVISALIDFPLW